ncbi:hypothetical protein MPH_03368 [Macrophomina phaseolina MS6]|uniref:Nephrocystin 3-like N-terminal domain-containing protein n=1 Tax=Macrophomina phaseolina (strain MS6) TaxID=1126212 RepID=K2SAT1_MACPH|nr:hypothetical protein MPH_03368 [Macrophomina phaseolina MS6]
MAPKLRKRIRNKLFAPCRSRSDTSSNQPARISQPQAPREASPIPEDAFPAPATAKPWKTNFAGSEYSQSIRAPLRVVNPSSSTYSVDTDLPPKSAVSEKPPPSAPLENKATATTTIQEAPTETNGQNESVRVPQPPATQGLVAASPDPDEASTTATNHPRQPLLLDNPASAVSYRPQKARLNVIRRKPVDSPFASTFPDSIASSTADALRAAAESVEELRAALELDPTGNDDSASHKPTSDRVADDSASAYSKAPSEPSSFVSVPLTVGDASAAPCQPDLPLTRGLSRDTIPAALNATPESDHKLIPPPEEKQNAPKTTAAAEDSASSYSRTTGEPSHQDDVDHDYSVSVEQALIDAQLMREIEEHLTPSSEQEKRLELPSEPVPDSTPKATEKTTSGAPVFRPAPPISDDFLAGPFSIEVPVPTFFAELTLRPAPRPMKAFSIDNPVPELTEKAESGQSDGEGAGKPAATLQPAVTDDELRSTTPASIRSSIADEDLAGLQAPVDSSSRYDSAAGEDEGSPEVMKSPDDKHSSRLQLPLPDERACQEDKNSSATTAPVESAYTSDEQLSVDDSSSQYSSLNGPTLVEDVDRSADDTPAAKEAITEFQKTIEVKGEEPQNFKSTSIQCESLLTIDLGALDSIEEEDAPEHQAEEVSIATLPEAVRSTPNSIKGTEMAKQQEEATNVPNLPQPDIPPSDSLREEDTLELQPDERSVATLPAMELATAERVEEAELSEPHLQNPSTTSLQDTALAVPESIEEADVPNPVSKEHSTIALPHENTISSDNLNEADVHKQQPEESSAALVARVDLPEPEKIEEVDVFEVHPEEHIAQVPAGPFSSVFATDTYTTWKAQGGLLAVRGAPGAGKSTLITRIGETFLNATADGESHDSIASYTFHGVAEQLDARNSHKKVVTAMFHALVHQLMRAQDELSEAYTSAEEAGWDLSETELQDLLLKHVKTRYHDATEKEKTRLWIFIDAVDEVGEAAAKNVFEFFARLAAPKTTKKGAQAPFSPVAVCLACRSGASLLKGVSGQQLLQLHAEDFNREDLSVYLKIELATILDHLSISDAEEVGQAIQRRSNGVFLWAILAVDLIRRSCEDSTLEDILRHISAAPSTLEDVYEQRISSVPEPERARCARLLQWVCFATRPLTLPARWPPPSPSSPAACCTSSPTRLPSRPSTNPSRPSSQPAASTSSRATPLAPPRARPTCTSRAPVSPTSPSPSTTSATSTPTRPLPRSPPTSRPPGTCTPSWPSGAAASKATSSTSCTRPRARTTSGRGGGTTRACRRRATRTRRRTR